jgi:hypothetical protein
MENPKNCMVFLAKFQTCLNQETAQIRYQRVQKTTHFLIMCSYKKLGIMVMVTICGASAIIFFTSLSFIPTTFWPSTSKR